MQKRVTVISSRSSTLDRPGVESHVERCVHTRHRSATCSRCLEACPAGAISLEDGLAVDTDKCTGCGVCATVCPSGAFEPVAPAQGELCARVESRAGSGTVTFCCENHICADDALPPETIKLPCLGRIEESVLLTAAAAGAKTVRLLNGDCPDCVRKRGSDVAICAGQQVNTLLETLGCDARIEVVSGGVAGATLRSLQAGRPGAFSRREFFSRLWRAAGEARERIAADAPDEEPAPPVRHRACLEPEQKYAPSRWGLMAAALSRLQPAPLSALFQGDLWGDVTIGGRCTGCGICAASCPTGALHPIELDGKTGLAFTAARCTGCGLCADVCSRESIRVTQYMDLRRIVEASSEILSIHENEAIRELTTTMETKFTRLFEKSLFN